MGITPEPTEEEVAAIVAALDAVTPGSPAGSGSVTPRWRWSGRWWSKPVPMDRSRPW
jgi:hypothetical protein